MANSGGFYPKKITAKSYYNVWNNQTLIDGLNVYSIESVCNKTNWVAGIVAIDKSLFRIEVIDSNGIITMPAITIIDNLSFGFYATPITGATVSARYDGDLGIKDTLNLWTYNVGKAPTIEEFEIRIGFALINPVTDGTRIGFDNPAGYTIKDAAFKNRSDLLNIKTVPDVTVGFASFQGCGSLISTGLVTTVGVFGFSNCISLISTGLVTTVGGAGFRFCTSLANMDFSNCDNFGTTTDLDNVFFGIVGLTINLKAKAIHQTSNFGAMEGDLQYLFNNNTVNVTWV